ncbi:hypothetical protein RCO48_34740 [Peribacillus frigoritolerans]|nr:hypothetical protein [Peribacillus frigoritolerans]
MMAVQGLDCPLSKKLVELQNGKIEIESKEKKGNNSQGHPAKYKRRMEFIKRGYVQK